MTKSSVAEAKSPAKSDGVKYPASSLFAPAKNTQAFLKAGILGFAGSGKTHTAWEIAAGLAELLRGSSEAPPILFLDTENGSDYMVELAEQRKLALLSHKTRAFVDLLAATAEAERLGAILMIDSITHFWIEIQDAMKKTKGRDRLQFQDWGPIKQQWAQFTDPFVNGKFHAIMNGRAGFEYEYTLDDDGKKQLEKTGTKMKTEAELGYEPSLLIEMERVTHGDEGEGVAGTGVKKKVIGRQWDHRATILKDRSRRLHGMVFTNPTFEEFKPAITFLNLGGAHAGVDTKKDSTALFDGLSDKSLQKRIRDVKVTLEEIEGLITKTVPGTAAADKVAKIGFLEDAFGTRSWTAIESMRLEDLIVAYDKLQGLCDAHLKAKGNATETDSKAKK